MLELTDTPSRGVAQAERKPPPWPRSRVRSMLRERRVMLQNLAARRVYRNQPLGEPRTWAYYVAEIAWLCYRHGGDLASFRRAAPQVPPYFVISDAVAKKALKLVGRRKTRNGARSAARAIAPPARPSSARRSP